MSTFGLALILQIVQMTIGIIDTALLNGDFDQLANRAGAIGKLIYYSKYLATLAHGGVHAAASIEDHVLAPEIPHPPALPLTRAGLLSWADSLPDPKQVA